MVDRRFPCWFSCFGLVHQSFTETVVTVSGWRHPLERITGWKALQAEKARHPGATDRKKTPKNEEKKQICHSSASGKTTNKASHKWEPKHIEAITAFVILFFPSSHSPQYLFAHFKWERWTWQNLWCLPSLLLHPPVRRWLASPLTPHRCEDVCFLFHVQCLLSHLPRSSLMSFFVVYFPPTKQRVNLFMISHLDVFFFLSFHASLEQLDSVTLVC